MQIHGPAHVHGPHPLAGPHQPRQSAPLYRTSQSAPVDELQISQQAFQVADPGPFPEIRLDRVNAIRAQIAKGTYETPEKLEAALDRLLDELA